MKKLWLLFIAITVTVLVTGCASAPAAPAIEPTPAAPSWLAELPPAMEVWGIGFAKLQNESLAMQTATTRAQAEAALQISSLVQAMLTDYASESGIIDNPRSIIAIENIQRNIINMNLSGSGINARERMSDGTWWVRIAVKKEDALKQIDLIINNEAADYAEFRADQAIRQLDYQLNNAQTKPTPRGED
ncbi:MAG: hypothetical protein FWC21_02165 [Treponema sp.]|nr:hypothetical protein [Treponema sp.]